MRDGDDEKGGRRLVGTVPRSTWGSGEGVDVALPSRGAVLGHAEGSMGFVVATCNMLVGLGKNQRIVYVHMTMYTLM